MTQAPRSIDLRLASGIPLYVDTRALTIADARRQIGKQLQVHFLSVRLFSSAGVEANNDDDLNSVTSLTIVIDHGEDEDWFLQACSPRPDSWAELQAETELEVRGLLHWLPYRIGQLTALRRLSIASLCLDLLPVSIGQLIALSSLRMENNRVQDLPESIGQLKGLQQLHAWNNSLASLPETIGQLHNLQELWLWNNCIAALPESIGDL